MQVLRIIAFLLLLVAEVFAAPQTQYINTAATCVGQNGTLANPYCSYTAWESQNRNLVAEDITLTVVWAGPAETGQWTQAGWTTDATRNITYSGFKLTSTAYGVAFTISDSNIVVQDSEIGKNVGSTNIRIIDMSGQNILFERNTIFHGPATTRDTGTVSISFGLGGINPAKTVTFRNNVFYNLFRNGLQISCSPSDNISLYNNTIVGVELAGITIEVDTGSCAGATYNIRNNIVYNAAGDDYNLAVGTGTLNSGANISQDATSPDVAYRNKTLTFVNVAANNYKLAPSDTAAIGQGLDLSGVGVTVDRDNVLRTVPYDVGAYKYSASAGSSPLATLKVSGRK